MFFFRVSFKAISPSVIFHFFLLSLTNIWTSLDKCPQGFIPAYGGWSPEDIEEAWEGFRLPCNLANCEVGAAAVTAKKWVSFNREKLFVATIVVVAWLLDDDDLTTSFILSILKSVSPGLRRKGWKEMLNNLNETNVLRSFQSSKTDIKIKADVLETNEVPLKRKIRGDACSINGSEAMSEWRYVAHLSLR